jgi:transposase
MNSVRVGSWTGRGVRSTRSASGLPKGGPDGSESCRSRQERVKDPLDHRPRWPATVCRNLRRQHPRQQGAGATGGGIPPIRSRRGPRRRRPAKLHADKAYDHAHLRAFLRRRGIIPRIARRGIDTSQRLGRHRWVVERTVSWLSGFHWLHRRYERLADHFLVFVGIAAALICYRRLTR